MWLSGTLLGTIADFVRVLMLARDEPSNSEAIYSPCLLVLVGTSKGPETAVRRGKLWVVEQDWPDVDALSEALVCNSRAQTLLL